MTFLIHRFQIGHVGHGDQSSAEHLRINLAVLNENVFALVMVFTCYSGQLHQVSICSTRGDELMTSSHVPFHDNNSVYWAQYLYFCHWCSASQLFEAGVCVYKMSTVNLSTCNEDMTSITSF